MRAAPLGPRDTTDVVLLVLGVAGGVVAVVWAGAQLASLVATGDALDVDLGDAARATRALPDNAGAPARAWPPGQRIPGPWLYWPATALVAATAAGGAWGMWWLTAPRIGTEKRIRLGVDTNARLARVRDLRTLIVNRPTKGRLILGRVHGRLVATEDRQHAPTRRRLSRRLHPRQGDRSAVAMIGPARCGKTSNVIAGILEWDGPAILSSVKADLLHATHHQRAAVGEVAVFDPTGATGWEPTVGWSPLRGCGTREGAQKATQALADAAPRQGATNTDYFIAMAQDLLWPTMYAAAVGGCAMADVVRWVNTQDRPSGDGTVKPRDNSSGPRTSQIESILAPRTSQGSKEQQKSARVALQTLEGIWYSDDRTRGSTYSTAKTLIRAWGSPGVEAAAAKKCVDLDWIMAGDNTLYISAPMHDQRRLSVVFGGLMGDLLEQAYEHHARTNQPLDPPLLFVMDEAGNTPAAWLPEVASTCASIGILLVTIWQSKSQIDAAYGRLADSVLTNHGTKLIFSGVSDDATLRYVADLLGSEEVAQRAATRDVSGLGSRHSLAQSAGWAPLAPAELLRRLAPREGLLLHATLPPTHLNRLRSKCGR